MEEGSFFLDVWFRGDSAVIVCAGELDVSTSGKLRDAIDIAVQRGPSEVHLDCSGVGFLSAAGISAIVGAVAACRAAGIKLRLSLSQQIRHVLDMVGLWWLGVIDDGMSIEVALEEARRLYAAAPRRTATNLGEAEMI